MDEVKTLLSENPFEILSYFLNGSITLLSLFLLFYCHNRDLAINLIRENLHTYELHFWVITISWISIALFIGFLLHMMSLGVLKIGKFLFFDFSFPKVSGSEFVGTFYLDSPEFLQEKVNKSFQYAEIIGALLLNLCVLFWIWLMILYHLVLTKLESSIISIFILLLYLWLFGQVWRTVKKARDRRLSNAQSLRDLLGKELDTRKKPN
jgi:hypothetical protein